MNAVRLHAPRDLRIGTAPALPAPAAGQARLKVGSVGICGSDLHMYETGRIGNVVIETPLVLGHEFGGIVLDAADGSRRRPGQATARGHPRRGGSRGAVPAVPPVRGGPPEPLPAPLLLRRMARRRGVARRDDCRGTQLLSGAGRHERAGSRPARDAGRRRPRRRPRTPPCRRRRRRDRLRTGRAAPRPAREALRRGADPGVGQASVARRQGDRARRRRGLAGLGGRRAGRPEGARSGRRVRGGVGGQLGAARGRRRAPRWPPRARRHPRRRQAGALARHGAAQGPHHPHGPADEAHLSARDCGRRFRPGRPRRSRVAPLPARSDAGGVRD